MGIIEKNTFQSESFVYNEKQRFYVDKCWKGLVVKDETNCNNTGYFLCRKVFSYGCVAGYFGDGSGGSDYTDGGSLNAYYVSRVYCQGFDR